MTHDPRCCGSGACIVDPDGRCWCGQQWDGDTMCRTALAKREDPVDRLEPAGQPGPSTDSA